MELHLEKPDGAEPGLGTARTAIEQLLKQQMPGWISHLANQLDGFRNVERQIGLACNALADQLTAAVLAESMRRPEAQASLKKQESKPPNACGPNRCGL